MIFETIGVVLIIIGVFFSGLGVVGLLRFPDTYTRLHASGKTGTLGIVFICLGTAFILPSAILKLIALVVFIIFTAPVGSHAIAAAVHRRTAVHNAEAEASGSEDVRASGVHERVDWGDPA